MKKRRFHYVLNPKEYDIQCDKCRGFNIEWSEYDGKIWCYDCKIDTDGTKGVFSGPIPLKIAGLLGYNLSRYDIETKKILEVETEEWEKSFSVH